MPGAGLRPTTTAGVEDGQRADREEILLLAEKGGSMTGSGRAQGNAGATLSRGRRQRTLRQRALDDKREQLAELLRLALRILEGSAG